MLRAIFKSGSQIGTFLAFFLLWEVIVRVLGIKPVILPAPSAIIESIYHNWPYLMEHAWPTLLSVVLGFVFATLAGFIIAVGIAYSRWISEVTYPFLITAQLIPKVALAPLFLIWFGFGMTPKVIIAALVAFFPIVINTAKGLRSVDVELLQYMQSLGAGPINVFMKISLPWAMPYIFASLKIAITLSVIGAVVGEFVASDSGLGYVINYANIMLDTELMFAGIFVLSFLGVLLFLAIALLERLVMSWQSSIDDLSTSS